MSSGNLIAGAAVLDANGFVTGFSEKQSWAFDVRDTFFNALSGDSFFVGYTAKKNKMVPIQPDQMPFLGVYMIEEVMTPDGDANAGCIRFNHAVRIGFQVINANNDQNIVEKSIDQAYLRIQQLLFTDQHIMNVLVNQNVENVGIESVTRGTHKKLFGSTGLKNEIPFAELQYEISCFFRTEWYPDITNMLDEIDVTVAVNNVDPSTVPPITIKYMLDQLRLHRVS